MTTITEEGLARVMSQMMAQMLAQAQAQAQPVPGEAGPVTTSGSGDIFKHYSRVEKLGGADEWREWHYQFVVATKARVLKTGALLEIVENQDLDEVDSDNLIGVLAQDDTDHMQRTGGEIYSVLSLLTKGEANQVVRGVDDMNGYVAWKRLYDRFNPRTPASLTAAWRDVIRPKKVRDLREIVKVVDVWEAKVMLLKREHGEEPTPGLKASLLLEMLPDSVQLTVAQGMPGRRLDYDGLKAKVRLMASVQADMATPKPMDVGELQEHAGWCEHCGGEGEDVEAVGKGKGRGPMFGSCWTCGGPHFSNECPNNIKGTKGGKGVVKGTGKGEPINKGKGKGKLRAPMYGSCWLCGGAHFQAECPNVTEGKGSTKGKGKGKSLREVDEESEDQQDVGSVTETWNIFGLDIAKKKKRDMGRLGRWARGPPEPLRLRNRFGAMQEIEEVEEMDTDCHDSIDCVSGKYGRVDENCRVRDNCVTGLDDGVEDWIQWVTEDGGIKGPAVGEIVIDSGAAESVCPWDWARQFPMREVPWDRKRDFRNASGGKMEHYGEKKIQCGFDGLAAPVNMTFQVSDCRNPLASVARIVENGNIVQFGPKATDNFIFNPTSGERVMLRKKGRKFVLDAKFDDRSSHFSGQA